MVEVVSNADVEDVILRTGLNERQETESRVSGGMCQYLSLAVSPKK